MSQTQDRHFANSLDRVRCSCAWIFYSTLVHFVRKAKTIIAFLYFLLKLNKQNCNKITITIIIITMLSDLLIAKQVIFFCGRHGL